MEFNFILSQILKTISFGFVLYAFQIKGSKKFRILFVIASIFNSVHFILLGTLTAAVMAFINGLRWFTSSFFKQKFIIYIFIGIIFITLYYTYTSPVSVLPAISGILATIAAFQEKEIQTRKILFSATGLWIIHNIVVFSPVGVLAEVFFLISNFIGYRKMQKSALS